MEKITVKQIPTNTSVFYFIPQVTLAANKGSIWTVKHIWNHKDCVNE